MAFLRYLPARVGFTAWFVATSAVIFLSVSAACQRRMFKLASIARSESEVIFMMWCSKKVNGFHWKEIERPTSAADHELSEWPGHGLDVSGCVAELCIACERGFHADSSELAAISGTEPFEIAAVARHGILLDTHADRRHHRIKRRGLGRDS